MLDYLRIMLDARGTDRKERGASAVEYGLLITGIAALIVVSVLLFGNAVTGLFTGTCSTMKDTRGSGSCG